MSRCWVDVKIGAAWSAGCKFWGWVLQGTVVDGEPPEEAISPDESTLLFADAGWAARVNCCCWEYSKVAGAQEDTIDLMASHNSEVFAGMHKPVEVKFIAFCNIVAGWRF